MLALRVAAQISRKSLSVKQTCKLQNLQRPSVAAVFHMQKFVPEWDDYGKQNSLRNLSTDAGSANQMQCEEPDTLYGALDIEVKGHDPAVLKSYQQFVRMTAAELDISLVDILTPPKHFFRRTLLKSAHVFKKHRVQYEIRTHYKLFKIQHITGSTADTFLEYIQRNLPEGVAMKVTKHQLEALPDHFKLSMGEK